MDELLRTLMDDFNVYRGRTNHFQKLQADKPYIKLPKLTKEREKLLTEMVAWCRTNSLEPRHWLYCLFARNRWLFAPKWTPGFLMSETGLKWYRAKARTVDDGLYRQRVAQTHEMQKAAAGASQVYDPNIHIAAEVEARKQRHLQRGDWAVCALNIADAQAPTLGFHPQSKVCAGCPGIDLCKEKLRSMFPFDIVALREGKITVQQAQLAAAVQRGRA